MFLQDNPKNKKNKDFRGANESPCFCGFLPIDTGLPVSGIGRRSRGR
jgi:hypothetical protein